VTNITFFVSRNVDAFFHAFGGFFKRNLYADLQVRAAVIRLTAACAAATAEHLAENIGKIEALCTTESALAAETAKATESARTCALFKRGMAVLVVHGTFFPVGKRFIGPLHLFEFFFRHFVAVVAVGMVFHRQLAVGFFNFVVGRATRHAECCIKILVAHDSDGC
jgi:hypothetical protein